MFASFTVLTLLEAIKYRSQTRSPTLTLISKEIEKSHHYDHDYRNTHSKESEFLRHSAAFTPFQILTWGVDHFGGLSLHPSC